MPAPTATCSRTRSNSTSRRPSSPSQPGTPSSTPPSPPSWCDTPVAMRAANGRRCRSRTPSFSATSPRDSRTRRSPPRCTSAITPSANAAALTNLTWSVSNNQVSATNVTYSYSFKTATTGTIKTITFAVSGSGLAGTPTISRNYGIGAGSVSISGQTITYTVTSAVSVSTGIPIYVEFAGLTNSGTAASYTTAITTQTSVPATI